jgi:hypothetical protein
MKRFCLVFAAVLVAATLACAQGEVSLGDAARKARQNQGQASPNAKVYDNDNLPKSGNLSTTTGDYAGIATSAGSARSSSATGATGTAAAGKEGGSDADKKKQEDEFRQKVGEVKKNIDQLSRELDVMQREQRLRAAAYYGDAGTKLRGANQYAEDDKKYQETLQAKQTELDAAKAALEQLRDDIRKAGLSSSVGE